MDFLPFPGRENSTNFADDSGNYRQIFSAIFKGWDVSLAIIHSIWENIRIRIRIAAFLTEFLPLKTGNCKNFAGSVALPEVFGLRVLLVRNGFCS